jgi:hypothetical protein
MDRAQSKASRRQWGRRALRLGSPPPGTISPLGSRRCERPREPRRRPREGSVEGSARRSMVGGQAPLVRPRVARQRRSSCGHTRSRRSASRRARPPRAPAAPASVSVDPTCHLRGAGIHHAQKVMSVGGPPSVRKAGSSITERSSAGKPSNSPGANDPSARTRAEIGLVVEGTDHGARRAEDDVVRVAAAVAHRRHLLVGRPPRGRMRSSEHPTQG